MRPRPLWILVVASVLFGAALALDLVPELRGDFGWRWPYTAPEAARLLPVAAAVIVYLAGAVMLLRRERRRLLLMWATVGTALVTLAAMGVAERDLLFALFTRTASGVTTGVHLAAAKIAPDVGAALRDWPGTMAMLFPRSTHVAVAPPGLPLLNAAVAAALEAVPGIARALSMAVRPYQCHNLELMAYTDAQMASAWMGILMPLWAGLAVWPLYDAGRRLGGETAGARAAVWWPMVPGIVMFTPTWNTFFPVLAVSLLALMLRATPDSSAPRRAAPVVLAGVLAGACTFLTFAMTPLLLFIGLYILLDDRLVRRAPLAQSVRTGLWFGVGLVIPWGLYWLYSGLTPLDLFLKTRSLFAHFESASYHWLWLHLYDFALFAGLPLVALALWKLVDAPRRREGVLGIALLLTLLAVTLVTRDRVETGRVWTFFTPFVLLLAALAPPLTVGRWQRPWYAITIAQAVMLLTMVGFLRVIGSELGPPPTYPPPGDAPPGAQPANVVFGDAMRLRAYAGDIQGDQLHLTLRWEALARPGAAYWFSGLLVGPDGALGGKRDWQPGAYGLPPTTCWTPGMVVQDEATIPLEGLAPHDVWVSLSVFDIRTGARLPMSAPGAPPDDQVGLGPFN